MPGQESKATQVSTLGETPAQARARMKASGADATPPSGGVEVKGPLTPQHLAAIEVAEGGFRDTGVQDGPVEDFEEPIEPPTPTKAMAMINQLSQDKNQLQAELDASLNVVERYRAKYGDLEES